METDLDVDQICKEILEKALKSTKCSLGIKCSDFNYFNSFDKFSQILRHQSNQSLIMLSSLIQNENKSIKVEKMDSIEDIYECISEINDNMFDKIGNHLDEASGLKKRAEELVLATISTDKNISVNTSSWNRKIIKAKKVGFGGKGGSDWNLLSAKMVDRSQLRFKDRIDNSNHPFIPNIKEKPNSIKPLAILVETNEYGFDTYSHPYEVEIEKFEPNDQFLQIEIPELPKPVSETKFELIVNREQLIEMCAHLKTCKQIAVDLEHHSYRTFQGFTCLMQISTKSCDYVIDSIELRSDLHLLNEVFTSPAILKIFHGSDMDIVWMQRDFGLYVVNLFDTYQSAKLLNFPHLSLSYLLKHYCNFEPNKQFQLADWRIRPLNDELLKYAREDTHYLIFIYIQMKNELIARGNNEKNLLRTAFQRSQNVCLKKYEKPLYNSESYRSLLKKSKVNFNSKQLFALKELYAWRDRMARNEDESIGYVLPNHMLLHIAEVLPREQQGILSCCNPIPPLVKQQLNEIHLIILKARDKPLVKTDENTTNRSNISNLNNRVIDLDELMDCRHDRFPLDSDINAQTLIGEYYAHDNEILKPQALYHKTSPFVEFFSKKLTKNNQTFDNISSTFISQFERYNLTISGKEKSEKESEETLNCVKPLVSDNVNRVYSHYLNLTTGSESKSESINESIETNESTNTSKPEINVSDISFTSIDNLNTEESNRTTKTKQNFKSDKSVKPFNYEEYDYSNFSAKNSTNSQNTSREAKNQQMFNKKKNFKRRNESKSFTYNPNKKQKF